MAGLADAITQRFATEHPQLTQSFWSLAEVALSLRASRFSRKLESRLRPTEQVL